MEYFAQNLGWWSLFFFPALIYLGIGKWARSPASAAPGRAGTVPARRPLPGAAFAGAVALIAGTLIVFGLIDIVCTWTIDALVMPRIMR